MSWLSSFLKPGKAYKDAQKQLDKYYGQSQGFLQPYNTQGQEQYSVLQDLIKNLTNPQELLDKWSQGYTESESAKNAERMAQEHGLNAASSMGLMGSNTALDAIQRGTTQIGLDERENFLNNLMQKYLAGAGLSQGIYGTGANTAGQMSNNATNMGQNSAEMAYGRQQAGGNMLGNLIGMAGSIAGSALGGPMGGALAKRWNLSGGA